MDYFISEKRKASLNLTVLPHITLFFFFAHNIGYLWEWLDENLKFAPCCLLDWHTDEFIHNSHHANAACGDEDWTLKLSLAHTNWAFADIELIICDLNQPAREGGFIHLNYFMSQRCNPTAYSLSLSLSLTIHSAKCGNNIVVKWIKPPRPTPPIKSRTECGV